METIETLQHEIEHLRHENEELKQDKTDILFCLDQANSQKELLRDELAEQRDKYYEYKAVAFKYERLVQYFREITSLLKSE